MAGGEITFGVTDFQITLDEDAVRKLAGGEDIQRALITVGQIGEGSAKQHVRVDTGNLRRSITHELGERGLVAYVRIGTNVDYAVFQELGTENMEAQPFLRPAMEEVRSRI